MANATDPNLQQQIEEVLRKQIGDTMSTAEISAAAAVIASTAPMGATINDLDLAVVTVDDLRDLDGFPQA